MSIQIEAPATPRMTAEELRERIIEELCHLSDSDVIEIHNSICDDNNDSDSRVYPITDFWDYLAQMTPEDAFNLDKRDFFPSDDYFYWDGYGAPCTFESIQAPQSPIDLGDIADTMIRNWDAYDEQDIQDLFDLWDEWEEYDEEVRELEDKDDEGESEEDD